jgi:hypothetical protein
MSEESSNNHPHRSGATSERSADSIGQARTKASRMAERHQVRCRCRRSRRTSQEMAPAHGTPEQVAEAARKALCQVQMRLDNSRQ